MDPYFVDPEDLFWQLGPLMHARPGSEAAALTEKLLELNRPELIERRTERQINLMRMLNAVEQCENQNLKQLLWKEFEAQSESQNEYAALSRTVIQHAKRELGYS